MRTSLEPYEDVLPPGLVNRVKGVLNPTHIPLVQQLVNMVGKRDTGESHKEKALAKLKRYKTQLSDTEYGLLLDVVNWVARNVDYVKRRRYRNLYSKYSYYFAIEGWDLPTTNALEGPPQELPPQTAP